MATWDHNEIVANLMGFLVPLLRGTGHQGGLTSDGSSRFKRTRSLPGRAHCPGAVPVRAAPEGKELVLLNPLVVIEVLSESTAHTDRGEKLDDYLSIPTVTDYLIVDQDEARVEHLVRTGDGWREQVHEGTRRGGDVRGTGGHAAAGGGVPGDRTRVIPLAFGPSGRLRGSINQ